MTDSDSNSDVPSENEGYRAVGGGFMGVSGVNPYMYEPLGPEPASEHEVEPAEVAGAAGGPEVTPPPEQQRLHMDVNQWCQCGNCETMETENECKCCLEIAQVEAKCREEEPVPKCMIEHPGFPGVCLNRWNLQALYYEYRQHYGQMRGQYRNNRYRYTAYRHFVRWCWGWLGKDLRVPLPSCVVLRIRKEFPSDTHTYTGFRLPELP